MTKQQKFLDALGEEAHEQIANISAARIYEGDNPSYRLKAKIAIGVIGAYVRLCATIENQRTNDLVLARLLGEGVPQNEAAKARLLKGSAG